MIKAIYCCEERFYVNLLNVLPFKPLKLEIVKMRLLKHATSSSPWSKGYAESPWL